MILAILPLARPTFDMDLARSKHRAIMDLLRETGHQLVGGSQLLLDAQAARLAMEAFGARPIDRLLVLQLTFTDAGPVLEASDRFDVPLSIWAVPEERLGGRLRLNAFCGLNLAAHALGLKDRPFNWLYRPPESLCRADMEQFLSAPANMARPVPEIPLPGPAGARFANELAGRKIGRIGERPDGFTTCDYDPGFLQKTAGIEVVEIGLDRLFSAASGLPGEAVHEIRAEIEPRIGGLDSVDREQLDRSLKLRGALRDMAADGGIDAFAVRCWPECFTEYGGAVCGPVAMMVEDGRPCACEADVYGAFTQLILQKAAASPVFLTDLVDVDVDDGTGVVWHCGQAPLSMCDADARPMATVHSNRGMPLLFQFALKPGRVTFARISQSLGQAKLVIAGGEMLKRPRSFTGTSGVVRFDSGARDFADRLIAGGLEHHMALAYGEHRPVLREVAAALGLPLLEL